MLTHVIWFLAVIAVALLVDRNAALETKVERAKWTSDLLSATLSRELWMEHAKDWRERYDHERDAHASFARAVWDRDHGVAAPTYDDDMEDPPTVGQADAEAMELQRVRREMAELRERMPIHMEDDDVPPAMRVTAGDDEPTED